MRIPFGRPVIGPEEREAVLAAIEDPILVHGPRAREFEKRFASWTGAEDAVCVSSCTAGMHLIWFTIGLGPGDEVIVPAQTHVATAHAVALTGAKPVFVDAERVTGNIDLNAVETAITPRTKGIAIVHYLGTPVDMRRLMKIARSRNIFVLEDCALAIGTRYNGTHAGLLGDAGVFSFYPIKHMTTAEGGMITTSRDELIDKLRLRRAFGVDRTASEREIPGSYDVVALGFNYRMNEIQAAIGIEQVKKLDQLVAQRTANFSALDAGLREIEKIELFTSSDDVSVSGNFCLNVMLEPNLAAHRTDIIQSLKTRGIGTSIYYPRPVPQMTYYRELLGHGPIDHPVANWISNSSIALPVGPHLDTGDMAFILQAIDEVLSRRSE